VCYSSTPPRYEYHLTPRGRDFRMVLLALAEWGNLSSPVALSTMIGSTRRWVAVSTSCI
jgi:DNA-binding HxlR family transcriptional regulator